MRCAARPAWAHRILLGLHPRGFREEYGAAMEEMLAQRAVAARDAGSVSAGRFWLRECAGMIGSLVREHVAMRGLIHGVAARTPPTHNRIPSMERLLREGRHARRRLVRSPAFTVATVLTLALAIGANTAIFAVVRGVVLLPLAYPDSDRLVSIDHGAHGLDVARGLGLSTGLYVQYRERARGLESIALHQTISLTATGGGEPERVRVTRTTPSLAQVLRVRPGVGRWFTDSEAEVDGPAVAVLSHGYWQRRYGGDPGVLGRAVTLDGTRTEIVGVMPAAFGFPDARTEVWIPYPIGEANTRVGGFNYSGVARLRDGATLVDATAEQNRLIGQLPEQFPGDPFVAELVVNGRPFAVPQPLKEATIGRVRATLWVLLGAVGIVLLVACANVANLFLVRAEGRQREVAVRRALGAGESGVAAFFLAESLLLALLGGVLGVALATAGVGLLVAYGPPDLPRLGEVRIEGMVVAFTTGLSLISALLFGAVPMVRRRVPLAASLHETGRGNTATAGRMRVRHFLMAAQVALSLVLLVASGLMARSFQRVRDVDPGFTERNVLAFGIGLPEGRYATREEAAAFHRHLLERLRGMPGVLSASATTCAPLAGFCFGDPIAVEGRVYAEGELPPITAQRRVAADYFETMGIAPLAGRTLSGSDHDSATRVAVIDERLAQLYFPGEDPIGKRLFTEYESGPGYGAPAGVDWYTVIGVVPHVVTFGLTSAMQPPQLYLPLLSHTWNNTPSPHSVTYVVRTATPPLSLARGVRDAVGELDSAVALAQVTALEEMLARARAPMAFTMVLIVIAGVVALFLGLIGIYGVISYAVSQRTGEIGVRMALGARPGEVSAMILRQGGRVAALGVAAGLAIALGASRLIQALLFDVSATDPATYAGVTAALLLVALVACWVPARRAARLDPVEALRNE